MHIRCCDGEIGLWCHAGDTPKASADWATAASGQQQQQQQLYVVQCISKLPDDTESDSGDSTSHQASNTLPNDNAANYSGTCSAAAGDPLSKPSGVECDADADKGTADDDTPHQALGRLAYVLRLCRSEAVEGVPHTSISEVQGAA